MTNGNTISFEIEGLKQLQDSLNLDRINKELAVSIGAATKTFSKSLESAIVQRYNISPSRFVNALQGSSSSLQTTGKNLIQSGFELTDIPLSLSRYVTAKEWGNIEPTPKRRKGIVHTVTVRRGRAKVSYGKYGYGGFTIKGGRVMVERTGPTRRAKLKIMYGPNIVDMAVWSLDYDRNVQAAFINLSDKILDSITL